MKKEMRIFLVRHGQSTGNVNRSEYLKHHDSNIELTDKGKIEALNSGVKICGLKKNQLIPPNKCYFNLVYSSYKRAVQTANIIESAMDNETFSIQQKIETPLCIEREWGSLRDIVSSKLKTDEHFNFYYRPNGGESFCDLYKRVAIFHQWLKDVTKYENNIVVAHGEFNKVYLMHLLNWNIEEFEKWKNQKNGEVWLINNGKLSPLTPLTPKYTKPKYDRK